MRPLTLNKPKCLLEVAGESLLQRALSPFLGLERIVVNGRHHSRQVRSWLNHNLPEARFSEETENLETGGGVKKALSLLGEEFFVINTDTFLADSPVQMMLRAWRPEKMDALLLLGRRENAVGYRQGGKYGFAKNDAKNDAKNHGRLKSNGDLAFVGIQILKAALFADTPKSFSLRLIYQKAEKVGRLYGVAYPGRWYHLGDPEALEQVVDVL